MRARRHHWIPTAIAATFVVTMGCRGGKPLGDLVQVTGGPAAAEVPDVEPPPQRLATARPQTPAASAKQGSGSATRRSPSETTSSLASAPAAATSGSPSGKPAGQEEAPAEKATAGKKAAEKTAGEQVAGGGAGKDETSSADRLAAGSSSADAMMKDIEAALETRGGASVEKTAEASSSRQPDAESRSGETESTDNAEKSLAERAAQQLAALPEDQRSELLSALGDSPPEVRQQAVRQLVAVLAREADSSDRPSGIDEALQQSLDHLPELAAASGTEDGPKPTRLASSRAAAASAPARDAADAGSSPQRITLSDQTDDAAEAGRPDEIAAQNETVQLADAPPRDDAVTPAVATEAVAESAGEDAIQPASATGPAGEADAGAVAQASATSEPAGPAASQLSDQQLYKLLLARLSQPVEGESEADRSRRKIMARHLMVLAGNPDRAVEGIEGLGEKEQEYLRHQLLGLWTIIDPKGHPVPGRRFTTALPQLREATKYLAAATDTLEVRSLAFCTEIESYGQVTEFPSRRFRPGQQVILYCEVDNFTAKRLEQGYETHLQGSYNVYDAQDRKVASQLLPADRQVSRNYLRDYFIAYQMHLPQQLSPGQYRLELTMEDINDNKYGQASLDFEIGE